MSDIHESLVDKRIVERNIKKGKLTRKDHEKYLSSLADRENNAERIRVGVPGESGDESEE
jgi:hypothetical protein